ncbi:hypothetical protein HPB51_028457 [Rhipicephalus microplus]|uniref:Uncharacterized protein n=1 Tax=Rhipicephalus microplus TaxID=6941 RepID=A0A9J6CXG2_RHIMP|nr:hypothetical protein HPB51_028457 [Rhipicephalus microplus]
MATANTSVLVITLMLSFIKGSSEVGRWREDRDPNRFENQALARYVYKHMRRRQSTEGMQVLVTQARTKLAALLHTCRYACAVTSAHPNAAEKHPVLEITTIHSAPCDLPPYVSPQGDAAQAARGTSNASSMAYLSRLPTSPQFSGHGMAAVTMVAKNPFCFFVQPSAASSSASVTSIMCSDASSVSADAVTAGYERTHSASPVPETTAARAPWHLTTHDAHVLFRCNAGIA